MDSFTTGILTHSLVKMIIINPHNTNTERHLDINMRVYIYVTREPSGFITNIGENSPDSPLSYIFLNKAEMQ